MINELRDWILGLLICRRAPMEIGFPSAVVFRIRNGIGFSFVLVSSISFSSGEGSLVLKRSATKTFGALDFVVIVLQRRKRY